MEVSCSCEMKEGDGKKVGQPTQTCLVPHRQIGRPGGVLPLGPIHVLSHTLGSI